MSEALQALNFRIARGQEFPDACYAVSVRYKVDYSQLADAYDAQFA